VDVTSRFAGVVVRRCAAVGDIVQVGAPLLELRVAEGDDDSVDVSASSPPPPPPTTAAAPPPSASTVHASPAVRRIARDLGVDLDGVPGSGPGGRVLKEDVERVAKGGKEGGVASPAAPTASAPPLPPASPDLLSTPHPIRGYRRAMVTAMTAAAAVPHFHLHSTASSARLASLRATLAADPALGGVKLTYLPFLVKALAQTAAAFPTLNASLSPDGGSILHHGRVNVGVAVDTPHGLAVPVVHDVGTRTIASIAAELARLRDAAVAGALAPSDVAGGTVSLSNIGALGGAHATPLVHPPQVAIRAVGRAADVVVRREDGSFGVDPRLPLSWGADHRVVDGATLARASALFEALLEEPARLLLRAA
jgi:2-oxoisovalerate dehydrogenase E2 component (dihydrolipoyl transacylase)